jgi:opacity protein-like surface antigen
MRLAGIRRPGRSRHSREELVMKSRTRITWAALAAAASLLGTASAAAAGESWGSRTEISVMGGIQAMNENDTALPDQFLAIPAVVTATYRLTPLLAVDGEFTWMLPFEQSVELGSGPKQDLKTPDVLAYQANLRATFPGASVSPYLAAGAGAVTFLSNSDSNRYPQLDRSETAFAVNFGGGVTYGVTDRWAVRADVRELVAFPSNDAVGFSQNGNADPVWMERGTVGLVYRF